MTADSQSERFAAERQKMVNSQLRTRGLRDERVLAAMSHVPRHEFVEAQYRGQAYEDHPLPIGQDQTISQPYIVALTLESLSLQPSATVLEIGTGSGYQTALLCELALHVYSIERHESLAREAAAILARLGYKNATVLVGDGSAGLSEHQPFDAIAVAAAAPTIPEPLLQQLREGGRMVIPVGFTRTQDLQLVRKQNGSATITSLGGCAFVPLIGEKGQFPG
jgi:protein-L-isoaspartate(D-aspartate) O-methyltransferase